MSRTSHCSGSSSSVLVFRCSRQGPELTAWPPSDLLLCQPLGQAAACRHAAVRASESHLIGDVQRRSACFSGRGIEGCSTTRPSPAWVHAAHEGLGREVAEGLVAARQGRWRLQPGFLRLYRQIVQRPALARSPHAQSAVSTSEQLRTVHICLPACMPACVHACVRACLPA